MKNTLTIILLLFSIHTLRAQSLKTGLIYPATDAFEGCCMHVPENGFKIYDAPSGRVAGQIVNGSPEYGSVYKLYLQKEGHPAEVIPYEKMEMVGYEIFSLVYTDKTDAFVKVLGQYWISTDEIQKGGLEAINYRDFLIKRTNDVLGYYAKAPGLNLRTGPSTDHPLIKTLQGDTLQITLTNHCEGLWCEVKVTELKKHPCVSGDFGESNVKRKYEGWIKVIDDEGLPNVWHYAKGC